MADPKGLLVVPIGYRADGSLHALELDNSDQLKVSAVLTTTPVIIDGASPSLLRPEQKNTFFSNLALPAGASDQTVLTVPTGQTWRITGGAFRYDGTAAGVGIEIYGYNGTDVWLIKSSYALVSTQWQAFLTNMLLTATNVIRAAVRAATLNDDLYVSILAERIY